VTAVASDNDGNSDTATDDATVNFTDVLPDITVTKNPDVTSVPETGGNVIFTFVITNNNAEAVTIDSVSDSDFTFTAAELDGILGSTLAGNGGSTTFSITRFLSGDYESSISHNNVFTAIAKDNDGNTDTATDDATVGFTDVTAQIDVEKYVWDGDSWEDADMAPGPILNQGTNPQFKFVVTNTGTGDLSNVTLTDSDFNIDTTNGDKTYEIGNLAVNESKELIFTASWTAGQHTNTGTAYGSFTDGAGNLESAADSDDANYYGYAAPNNQRSIQVTVPTSLSATQRSDTNPDHPGNETLTSYFDIKDVSSNLYLDVLIQGLDLDFKYRQGNKWVVIDPDTTGSYDQKTDPIAPESAIRFWVEKDNILGYKAATDVLIKDPGSNPTTADGAGALAIKEPSQTIRIGYDVDFLSLGITTPPAAPNGVVPDPLQVTAQVDIYNNTSHQLFWNTASYDWP
jgi:hypothetical protein